MNLPLRSNLSLRKSKSDKGLRQFGTDGQINQECRKGGKGRTCSDADNAVIGFIGMNHSAGLPAR